MKIVCIVFAHLLLSVIGQDMLEPGEPNLPAIRVGEPGEPPEPKGPDVLPTSGADLPGTSPKSHKKHSHSKGHKTKVPNATGSPVSSAFAGSAIPNPTLAPVNPNTPGRVPSPNKAGIPPAANPPDAGGVTPSANKQGGTLSIPNVPGAPAVPNAQGVASIITNRIEMPPPIAAAASKESSSNATDSGIPIVSVITASMDSKRLKVCTSNFPTSINDFGFRLFELLKKDKNNIFFSPLVLSMVLSITSLGAEGSTAHQMGKVLKLVKYQEDGFSFKTRIITESKVDYNLILAQAIYLDKSFVVNPEYALDVQNLDFKNDSSSAVAEINSWVTAATENTITQLVDAPLSPPPLMMLVGAAYFKGLWKTPFLKADTISADFKKTDGTLKKTQMMVLRQQQFLYLDDDKSQYKFLEMPYRGENISMLLALPRKVDSPADLKMTVKLLCSVRSGLDNSVPLDTVSLPKFRIEYSTNFKEPLEKLGMTHIFSSTLANLKGISPQKGLYVDSLIHKAVIEVDEGLSEGSDPSPAPPKAPPPLGDAAAPSFVADHPFLFYVIDKLDGVIYFSGKFSEP